MQKMGGIKNRRGKFQKLNNTTSSALVSDFTDQFALNALDLNMKFKFKWS